MQCPRGVALNSKGHIVFADVSLNKFTNIGNDGAYHEIVLTRDGIHGSVSLCLDRYGSLYVDMKTNMIAVFKNCL